MSDHELVRAILDVCGVEYRAIDDNWGRSLFLVPQEFKVTYDTEGKSKGPSWVLWFHTNGRLWD